MTATATPPAPGTPAAPITDPVDPAAPPTPPIEAPPAEKPDKPADPPTPPVVDPSKKAPEIYDLKLPAESTLDPAVIERTAAIARSLGLSNEAAQKALDLVHQEVTSAAEAAKDATLESFAPGGAEWTKQTESWAKETMKDPALGATPAERRAAIAKGQAVLAKYTEANAADAEAFKGFLNETGFGSHPVAARFFAWLGESAGEGKIVAGAPAAKEKSVKDIFYPKGANRTAEEISADGD